MEVPVDVKVETSPSAPLQYLLGTRPVIGDFDRQIQAYEFQIFTTLSILASVGIGIVGVFYDLHSILFPLLALGIGCTGILVDTSYYFRMKYFADLQLEVMRTTIDIEEAVVPHVMRGAGVHPPYDRFMLTKRLKNAGSHLQLHSVRIIVVAFAVMFLLVVALGLFLLSGVLL